MPPRQNGFTGTLQKGKLFFLYLPILFKIFVPLKGKSISTKIEQIIFYNVCLPHEEIKKKTSLSPPKIAKCIYFKSPLLQSKCLWFDRSLSNSMACSVRSLSGRRCCFLLHKPCHTENNLPISNIMPNYSTWCNARTFVNATSFSTLIHPEQTINQVKPLIRFRPA